MQTHIGERARAYFERFFFTIVYFFSLETTMSYGLERVWCITAMRGSNTIAIGYDEGSVAIKLGREEPAISMDAAGKIIWAKHSEMQQVNLKTLDAAALADAQGEPR